MALGFGNAARVEQKRGGRDVLAARQKRADVVEVGCASIGAIEDTLRAVEIEDNRADSRWEAKLDGKVVGFVEAPSAKFLCDLGVSNQCVRTLYSQQLNDVTPTDIASAAPLTTTQCGTVPNANAYDQYVVNNLFREMNEGDSPLTTASFVPAVDIYEDTKKVVLKLEVPGIDEKDLDIRVENNTLTVKGERKFEKEEKEENFHRIERRYGSFMRSFTLPNTVNPDSVKADYENGLLKIQFEKRAEAKPKQIQVNIGGHKTIEQGKGKAA